MRAVRFGSYSMCATFAGTPSLSDRLKSISRYWRLCPPPWCRVVILPCALRPPLLCSGRTSDFSGVDRVISAKSATLDPRRPGLVGLYLRMAITSVLSARPATEQVDAAALLGERDDRPLGVLALAVAGAGALALARAVERVHALHLDPEHLLHGDLDLRLVGVRVHHEGVLPLVDEPVTLLRDHGREQDVARVGDHSLSSSARRPFCATGPARNASSDADVNSTTSLTSTS